MGLGNKGRYLGERVLPLPHGGACGDPPSPAWGEAPRVRPSQTAQGRPAVQTLSARSESGLIALEEPARHTAVTLPFQRPGPGSHMCIPPQAPGGAHLEGPAAETRVANADCRICREKPGVPGVAESQAEPSCRLGGLWGRGGISAARGGLPVYLFQAKSEKPPYNSARQLRTFHSISFPLATLSCANDPDHGGSGAEAGRARRSR